MNNTITETPQYLIVSVHNTYDPTYFTASLQDRDMIESHRWRYINTEMLTTTYIRYECSISLESMILNSGRHLRIAHRNNIPLDYRRENLSFSALGKVNVILEQKNYATVCLPNAQIATIDLDDIPKVQPYFFRALYNRTTKRMMIQSHYMNDDGHSRQKSLERVVLQVAPTDGRHIIHKNGDDTDCRKSNLKFEEK